MDAAFRHVNSSIKCKYHTFWLHSCSKSSLKSEANGSPTAGRGGGFLNNGQVSHSSYLFQNFKSALVRYTSILSELFDCSYDACPNCFWSLIVNSFWQFFSFPCELRSSITSDFCKFRLQSLCESPNSGSKLIQKCPPEVVSTLLGCPNITIWFFAEWIEAFALFNKALLSSNGIFSQQLHNECSTLYLWK